MPELLLVPASLIASLVLTRYVRLYAIRRRLLDHPNERSSHQVPTPRGGGLAFVLSFELCLLVCLFANLVSVSLFVALAGGGILVALVGYIDDLHSLSPLLRIVGHAAAATLAVVALGRMPPLMIGTLEWDWGWFGSVVAVVAMVWMINLYNFMDGIDGLATIEAVFVSLIAGGYLYSLGNTSLALACWLLAAACAGFAVWNLPKAKIFMGDVGSGFLGYVLAVLAFASSQVAPQMLALWPVLLGVFIIDTLITLVRRVLARKRWYDAHRTHAYQHAVDRLGGHAPVTYGILAINLLWLLPNTLLMWAYPSAALAFMLLALLPLLALALYFRAGIELKRP